MQKPGGHKIRVAGDDVMNALLAQRKKFLAKSKSSCTSMKTYCSTTLCCQASFKLVSTSAIFESVTYVMKAAVTVVVPRFNAKTSIQSQPESAGLAAKQKQNNSFFKLETDDN